MTLSTAEMMGRSEDDCLRWLWRELYAADGVSAVCPKCRTVRKFHRVSGRRAFSCGHCASQVYPTVGTIFERSNLPLPTWFQAVRLILTSGGQVSGRRLEAELGVSYASALRIRTKVLTTMLSGGRSATLLNRLAHDTEALTAESDSAPTRVGAQPVSRTRERIRAAACRTFAERGLISARVADIAEEAGVSSAIIHYYFKSKEQVLLAALQWAGEQQDKRVTQIAEQTSDHVERLRRYLDVTVPREGILRDEYLLWLEVWVALRHRPELIDECVSMSDQSYAFLKGLIEDGVRAGAFTPAVSCQEITQRIVAIRDGLGYRSVIGYRGMDGTSVHRIMCEFVAEALGLPASALLGEVTQEPRGDVSPGPLAPPVIEQVHQRVGRGGTTSGAETPSPRRDDDEGLIVVRP